MWSAKMGNPPPRDSGPFTSDMGHTRARLGPNTGTIGYIFSTVWDFFGATRLFFVASATCRVQEDSVPVLWSYFSSPVIVGESLHRGQKGATCSRWNRNKTYFWTEPPDFGCCQPRWGNPPPQHWTIHVLTWAKHGPDCSEKRQNWVFFQHSVDFFGATRFFCGKCDMPFSRGQRARHFELLFVACYSRRVSTYGAEGCDMLQMEPIS